jgi:hypothetical protein
MEGSMLGRKRVGRRSVYRVQPSRQLRAVVTNRARRVPVRRFGAAVNKVSSMQEEREPSNLVSFNRRTIG